MWTMTTRRNKVVILTYGRLKTEIGQETNIPRLTFVTRAVKP